MLKRLLLLGIFTVVPASGVVLSEKAIDVGSQLEPFIRSAGIPGMAVAVLRGDVIVAQGVAGVRKKGESVPVEMGDEFEIASCAKAMTTTLVAMLIEDGKLRWDTTMGEAFGDIDRGMDPVWRRVTLIQLLHHRSGVTRDPYFRLFTSALSRGANSARRTFAIKELGHPPDIPPGTKYAYSNTNYILAAAVVEKITGRKWEDLLKERVFVPLKITSAGFGAPGAPGKLDEPWGHGGRRLFSLIPLSGASDIPFDPGSSSADYPLMAAPAGLIHMSLSDWATFAVLHLRGDPTNPNHASVLLKPEDFALLHRPEPGANDGYENYASGWAVGTRKWARGERASDTGVVIWHAGDNGRWNCLICLAPEIDFGLLIACNRASMWGACDQVAGTLIHEFAWRPSTMGLGGGVPGPGMAGHWQGMLQGTVQAHDLGLRLEINDPQGGGLGEAINDSGRKDSHARLTAVREEAEYVHLETNEGAVFDGQLNSDRSELAGEWKHHGYRVGAIFERVR